MGSVPTTTNTAAQTVDQIINGIIFDAAVPIAQAAIVAQIPFLGVWPMSVFLSMFLKWIGGYLYKGLAIYATFEVIALQTSAEKSAYAQAEAALRAAHLSGDPVALQKATADFKTTFQSLVHYDGSATP